MQVKISRHPLLQTYNCFLVQVSFSVMHPRSVLYAVHLLVNFLIFFRQEVLVVSFITCDILCFIYIYIYIYSFLPDLCQCNIIIKYKFNVFFFKNNNLIKYFLINFCKYQNAFSDRKYSFLSLSPSLYNNE